jgi:hypothetical protein
MVSPDSESTTEVDRLTVVLWGAGDLVELEQTESYVACQPCTTVVPSVPAP